jgi:hypothetical protein
MSLPTAPAPVEWHTHDADDRFPGQFTAHCATIVTTDGREYRVRITPGDVATYLAPGWHADVRPLGRGQGWWWTEHESLAVLKSIVAREARDDTDHLFTR